MSTGIRTNGIVIPNRQEVSAGKHFQPARRGERAQVLPAPAAQPVPEPSPARAAVRGGTQDEGFGTAPERRL